LADITDVAEAISLAGERDCGLSILPGKICNRDSVPFSGIYMGDYRFTLDVVPPNLVAIEPQNTVTDVPLDGTVTLTFSEPIASGRGAVSLGPLEYGVVLWGRAVMIPMDSPAVVARGSSLFVVLGGVQPGQRYTMSLPQGAVLDRAGNSYRGLPEQAYTFQTAAAPAQSEQGGGAKMNLPEELLIAVIAVACLVVVVAIAVPLMLTYKVPEMIYEIRSPKPEIPSPAAESQSVEAVRLDSKQRRPTAPAAVPATATASLQASGGAHGAWTTTTHEPPAAQGVKSAPAAQWAQKTSLPGGPGAKNAAQPVRSSSASAKVSPEPRNSSKQTRDPGPQFSSSKSSVTDREKLRPTVKDECPEVLAVAKKLRAMMDEPLPLRKKLLKDLMLEYHPDKNSQENAKEVFQYVNNSRSWFLSDS
ncbi:unnamed protein product, partial [Polarella glacialis]